MKEKRHEVAHHHNLESKRDAAPQIGVPTLTETEMWLIRKFVSWLLGEVEVAAEYIKPGDAVYKGEDGRWYKSKLQFDDDFRIFERHKQ